MRKLIFRIIKLSGLPYLFREVLQKNKVSILLFHDLSKEIADQTFHYLSKKYNIIHLNDFIEAIDKKDNSWTWNSKNVTSSSEGLPYFAYNRSCYWLISGDIKLYYKNTSAQQELNRIINFGPSNQTSCNNNASYTSNGTDITITLP